MVFVDSILFCVAENNRDILALEAPEMNQGYGRDGRSCTSVLYYLGEQQLVELRGGVGSYQVANLIRPLPSPSNPGVAFVTLTPTDCLVGLHRTQDACDDYKETS